MEWLADENISAHTVAFLRLRGENVLEIAGVSPGIPDEAVIALARSERRILLTFDSDHGDLIFNRSVPPPPAVVYFRLNPPVPQTITSILSGLIASGSAALIGRFTVVTADGMRHRALPVVV